MGSRLSAQDDAARYRDGYPDASPDVPDDNDNLEFYQNTLKCQPNNLLIEELLPRWRGNYRLLEYEHGYIQWLFPIREKGLNYEAQVLQPHEATEMSNDPVIRDRVRRSYELMLDFFGMRLADPETGEVKRNDDNYKDRYHNLSTSFHNYLRITRILKSLGELGFEHYKKHFLSHVLEECVVHKQLQECLRSLVDYWVPVLRLAADVEWLKGRPFLAGIDIESLRPEEYVRTAARAAAERARATAPPAAATSTATMARPAPPVVVPIPGDPVSEAHAALANRRKFTWLSVGHLGGMEGPYLEGHINNLARLPTHAVIYAGPVPMEDVNPSSKVNLEGKGIRPYFIRASTDGREFDVPAMVDAAAAAIETLRDPAAGAVVAACSTGGVDTATVLACILLALGWSEDAAVKHVMYIRGRVVAFHVLHRPVLQSFAEQWSARGHPDIALTWEPCKVSTCLCTSTACSTSSADGTSGGTDEVDSQATEEMDS